MISNLGRCRVTAAMCYLMRWLCALPSARTTTNAWWWMSACLCLGQHDCFWSMHIALHTCWLAGSLMYNIAMRAFPALNFFLTLPLWPHCVVLKLIFRAVVKWAPNENSTAGCCFDDTLGVFYAALFLHFSFARCWKFACFALAIALCQGFSHAECLHSYPFRHI